MASAELPTPDELMAVGRQLGMTLSGADVAFFLETMGGTLAAYHALEAMADPMPRVTYPRTPGHRPQGTDNRSTPGTTAARSRAPRPASSGASGSR
jgi:amidase